MIVSEEREYKILVLRWLRRIGLHLNLDVKITLEPDTMDFINDLTHIIEENYKSYMPEDK